VPANSAPALLIALGAALSIAIAGGSGSLAQPAGARAQADIQCSRTDMPREFDCVVTLSDRRTGEALGGVDLTIRLDMPSMPMAHNMRPVKATEARSGTYRARIRLDMLGDWALQLNLKGRVRDRVVKTLRFDESGAAPVDATRTAPGQHKH